MAWDAIIGQQRAKRLVQSALAARRYPHAWLFTGPEGVGKDAIAIEVAKVLRCDAPPQPGIACDSCRSCRTIADLTHANLSFVFALPSGKGEDGRADSPLIRLSDAEIGLIQDELKKKGIDPYHNISIPKAQQIKISSIRQIRRDISRSASEPGVRIVIVSEAQMMREEAANAFLKTLEEPTSEMLLILTSSAPDTLLPTITSRCQEIRFDRLAPEEISSALIERESVPAEQAGMLAHLSDGSYSRARALIDSDIHGERQEIVQFLRGVLRRSPIAAHEEIERLTAGVDRSELHRMLGLLQLWLRDLLILRLTGNVELILNRDQIDDLERFNAKFPSIELKAMIEALERCGHAVSRNAGPSLALTVLAFDIVSLCYADTTLTTA